MASGKIVSPIAYSSGKATSSYGNVYWYKYGRIVFVEIECNGIASNAWTQIASNLPKIAVDSNFSGVNTAAGSTVTLRVEGTVLRFYGRGSYSNAACAITYMAAS